MRAMVVLAPGMAGMRTWRCLPSRPDEQKSIHQQGKPRGIDQAIHPADNDPCTG